jgi:hypothetical protein
VKDEPCENCHKRQGTDWFKIDSDFQEPQWWCMFCILDEQIAHAEERAGALPTLRKQLEELRKQEKAGLVRPGVFLARIMIGVHFNERCCGDDVKAWDAANEALDTIIGLTNIKERVLYALFYRSLPNEP